MSRVTLDLYKSEERRMAMTEARRGLRIHAAVTVLVCLGLAGVNVFVASEFPWAIFPALGMSLGVWFHWYFGVQHGDEFLHQHQEDIEQQAERHAA
jgi:hypothetical protein